MSEQVFKKKVNEDEIKSLCWYFEWWIIWYKI